jgi:hypothetical protein
MPRDAQVVMRVGFDGLPTSKTSRPPLKSGSTRPIGKTSRLTSMTPFSTRTLCDRVPSGTLI